MDQIWTLLFIGYACDDDNFGVPVDNFDYAGQAIIDNDSLVDFLDQFKEPVILLGPLTKDFLHLLSNKSNILISWLRYIIISGIIHNCSCNTKFLSKISRS